ncbi:MAG: NAD-dependent epimerase/dehydratase family protein [Candidatus Thorarchaeota archaeon]|jgi:CDP-glucose 4,6-dehydratase
MANILVTGANGFVGSHLVERLKKNNKVVSLVHNCILGSWQENALRDTKQIDCDIRDINKLREIFARYEIDTVYHTAAISLVKTAFRDPLSVYDVNIMGTVAVLEGCRQVGVDRILIMNTDKVFGEGLESTEDKPYTHSEPYATSKCAQGLVALSFMDTYGLDIVMSHSCNIFGYDPYSNRIFPNVIKTCLKGKNPLIFTNDDTTREYVFVEDILDALIELASNTKYKGPYNISTNWVFNQKDIVLKILEHFESLEPKYVEGKLPQQIQEQSLSSIRWDWKPKVSFEDSISETIARFKKYRDDWA